MQIIFAGRKRRKGDKEERNMGNMKVLFCLILAASVNVNEAYRILCVLPYNGWSHFTMFEVICKGLAKKGHQIDMISHFPTKTPIANYTDIIDLRATGGGAMVDIPINYARSIDQWCTYYIATDYGSYFCHLMGTESMQKFIKNPPNDPPYDLVITEVNTSNVTIHPWNLYSKSLHIELQVNFQPRNVRNYANAGVLRVLIGSEFIGTLKCSRNGLSLSCTNFVKKNRTRV